MPAEFQRVMDTNPLEYPQGHAFIDDILAVTKRSENQQLLTVEKLLRKLNKENMS